MDWYYEAKRLERLIVLLQEDLRTVSAKAEALEIENQELLEQLPGLKGNVLGKTKKQLEKMLDKLVPLERENQVLRQQIKLFQDELDMQDAELKRLRPIAKQWGHYQRERMEAGKRKKRQLQEDALEGLVVTTPRER